MQKLKSFTIIFIFVIAALGLTISSARAAILTVDGGGQLTGATNVDLGSLGFFNVSFLDGTCIDLFTGCDAVSDFDFASLADATTAAQALLDQVFVDNDPSAPTSLFDSNPALTLFCGDPNICISFVPFAEFAQFISFVGSGNFLFENLDILFNLETLKIFDLSEASDQNYARFTAVTPVPLPPAALLFVTALIGLVGIARRQRQA